MTKIKLNGRKEIEEQDAKIQDDKKQNGEQQIAILARTQRKFHDVVTELQHTMLQLLVHHPMTRANKIIFFAMNFKV